jgi:hypothetical protein
MQKPQRTDADGTTAGGDYIKAIYNYMPAKDDVKKRT